jgi:uncharacterized membrane protein
MGRALQAGELPQAGARLALMRRIIGVNLVLGLVTIVIGAAKPF